MKFAQIETIFCTGKWNGNILIIDRSISIIHWEIYGSNERANKLSVYTFVKTGSKWDVCLLVLAFFTLQLTLIVINMITVFMN